MENTAGFFGDSNQSIMEFPGHPVQSVEETAQTNQEFIHKIYVLIIASQLKMAKVGEYIHPESRLSFACIKHGPKPRLIQTTSQLDKIIEYINNGLTDVGILVYYNGQVL